MKLKKVKFLTVKASLEPGFAPHRSYVSGANTTPSRITESMSELSPTKVKIPRAKKIATHIAPQANLFFILIVLLINYKLSQL